MPIKLILWFKAKVIIIFAMILVLFLLVGCFYWFQWRPSEIRKECSMFAIKSSDGVNTEYNKQTNTSKAPIVDKVWTIEYTKGYQVNYEVCLHTRGLQ